MARKKQPASERTVKAKIRKFIEYKEKGKAAYQGADRVLDELLVVLKPGQPVELGDGTSFVLVDQFEDRNVVFRPHGIRRFEGKVQ